MQPVSKFISNLFPTVSQITLSNAQRFIVTRSQHWQGRQINTHSHSNNYHCKFRISNFIEIKSKKKKKRTWNLIYLPSYVPSSSAVTRWKLKTSSYSLIKNIFIIIFLRFYLLIFRKRRRKGEREGEKHPCVRDTLIGCLLWTPNWRPGPQPRHVPWLGIKLVTFGSSGRHSLYWAMPARAIIILKYNNLNIFVTNLLKTHLLKWVVCVCFKLVYGCQIESHYKRRVWNYDAKAPVCTKTMLAPRLKARTTGSFPLVWVRPCKVPRRVLGTQGAGEKICVRSLLPSLMLTICRISLYLQVR